MMNRNSILLIVIVIITGMFSGCKKGNDDTSISFLSRKARICGEWKIIEGEVRYEAPGYIETDYFAGNALLTVQTPQQSYTGSYSWRFTINKNGTYKIYKNMKIPYNNAFITEEEGYWYFLSKNKESDRRNKECIAFQSVKVESDDVLYDFRTDSPTIYDIIQLSSKKLKLISDKRYKETDGASITEINMYESLIMTPN